MAVRKVVFEFCPVCRERTARFSAQQVWVNLICKCGADSEVPTHSHLLPLDSVVLVCNTTDIEGSALDTQQCTRCRLQYRRPADEDQTCPYCAGEGLPVQPLTSSVEGCGEEYGTLTSVPLTPPTPEEAAQGSIGTARISVPPDGNVSVLVSAADDSEYEVVELPGTLTPGTLPKTKMDVPGISLIHCVISQACMRGHGGHRQALEEAYQRIVREYVSCIENWERKGHAPGSFGNFHLVLTLDACIL